MRQPHILPETSEDGQLTLPSQRYGAAVLKTPLVLTITRDEKGRYIASDPAFHMHADGATPSEAAQNCLRVLIAYRRSLARCDEQLGATMLRQLDYLRTLIALDDDAGARL